MEQIIASILFASKKPSTTPKKIPIKPKNSPCNRTIVITSNLVAPSVTNVAISFCLFVTNINNDETILKAAMATINIKIMNITLFSLLIDENND